MTRFWRNWLAVWSIGIGLFGLVLYGATFPATTGPAAAIFALFGNPLPEQPDRYLRFAIGLMGAVTAGWAVTIYAAFRAAWALEGGAAGAVWRLITGGLIAWYVIDSAASIATGFWLNAVSNTAVLIGYLVPIAASGVLGQQTGTIGHVGLERPSHAPRANA